MFNRQSCGNCRFAAFYDGTRHYPLFQRDDLEPLSVDMGGRVVCRRYPPGRILNAAGKERVNYPAVQLDGWCGEHLSPVSSDMPTKFKRAS